MSLYTWKKEFCPVAAGSMVKKSKLAMVERDLRKWEGLTARNLKNHGLRRGDQEIAEIYNRRESFDINTDTCALCYSLLGGRCGRCPLYIVRDDVRCDDTRPHERNSPFTWFNRLGNPRPMIKWLRRAKEMLEEGR